MLHFGAGDARNGQGGLAFSEALAHGGLAIVGLANFIAVKSMRFFLI